jgi:hypothetical protein
VSAIVACVIPNLDVGILQTVLFQSSLFNIRSTTPYSFAEVML